MPERGNPLHYHKRFVETITAITSEFGLKLGKKKTKVLEACEFYAA